MKKLPQCAIVLGMGNTFTVPLGGFRGWMRFEEDDWVEDHCSGKTACMEYAAHVMSEVVTMNPSLKPEPVITETEMETLPTEEPEDSQPTRDLQPLIESIKQLWTRDMPIPEIPCETACVPEERVTIDPIGIMEMTDAELVVHAMEQIASTKEEAFLASLEPEVRERYLTKVANIDAEMKWLDENSADPHGISQHTPGAKNDKGKMEASLLLSFPRALWAVGLVASHGAAKYSREGWQHVPDGLRRYRDAEMRHMLKGAIEELDPDSGLPHLWHKVWNAIASLELTLREQEIHEHTTTETSQEATEGH